MRLAPDGSFSVRGMAEHGVLFVLQPRGRKDFWLRGVMVVMKRRMWWLCLSRQSGQWPRVDAVVQVRSAPV